MTLELWNVIIIGLLILNFVVLARVAMLVTQVRASVSQPTPQPNGKNGEQLYKTMADNIAEMLREFKPADGASISYRINALVAYNLEDSKNAVYIKAAQQEAVQAVRSAQEAVGRLSVSISTALEKLDALAISQARQTQEQAKIVNSIEMSGRDANKATLTGSTVEQLGAGAGTTQAAGEVKKIVGTIEGVIKEEKKE